MEEKLNQTEFDESKKPLLSLKYTQDGQFEGYITYLKDMKHLYVTENYDYVTKMNAMASTENTKPQKHIEIGQLALLRLVHTFARVRVVKKTSKSKSQVMLIDTGHEIQVENANLHEIPKNLSLLPPLAIALEISFTEVYPEALYADLVHLIGTQISFKLDENKKGNLVRIKNVSIYNEYLKSHLSYYGAIAHSSLFSKNSTNYAIHPSLTFVHNSVNSGELKSYPKQRITTPSSMLIPVLVFFMIFGSIGFIVAKIMSDKKKSATHSTTITIRPSPNDQKNNMSSRKYENNQIQENIPVQNIRSFNDSRRNVATVECDIRSPPQSTRNSEVYFDDKQNNERLQAGISMLSSIHQQSTDHGHYYSSSANTTFNNVLDHQSASSRAKTFPKRSTPITWSVKSSSSSSSELAYATSYTADELSQSGIIASFANTHDMFQNMTTNSNHGRNKLQNQGNEDSFHSSTSR